MNDRPNIRSLEDVIAFERASAIEDRGYPDATSALIARAAETWPDRFAITALADPEDIASHERCTYSELWSMVQATARLFREHGVQREGRICYITGASLDTMLAIWGGELAGIVAPINPYLEMSAIKSLLTDITPTIIVADVAIPGLEIWEKITFAAAELPGLRAVFIANASDTLPPFRNVPVLDFRRSVRDHLDSIGPAPQDPEPGDIAAYFHTGGTTGIPKLVPHTHRAQAFSSSLMADLLGWRADDAILMTLPLFHTNGVLLATLSALACGAEVVIAGPSGFRSPGLSRNFWNIVSAFGISSFSAVPSIYAALLSQNLPTAEQVRSLRFGISGGAPLSAELKQRAEALLGIRILEGYGLTEATLCVTLNPPLGEHRAGSIGIRAPYQDVRIVELNEDGSIRADCTPGRSGEIIVRSYSVMPGYRNIDCNRDVFTEDGYLRTGDLGYFDEDGYIWLTGRAKDLIIRGGHNIDPSEIERALAIHPDVLMVAAVGAIDRYSGEVPVAYLTLKPGSSTSTEEFADLAAKHIAERAAVPRRIVILDQMPLTPVGKIDKRHLKCLAASAVISEFLSSNGATAAVSLSEDSKGAMIAQVDGDISTALESELRLFPLRFAFGPQSVERAGAEGNG